MESLGSIHQIKNFQREKGNINFIIFDNNETLIDTK
jgi:hypothetical protein